MARLNSSICRSFLLQMEEFGLATLDYQHPMVNYSQVVWFPYAGTIVCISICKFISLQCCNAFSLEWFAEHECTQLVCAVNLSSTTFSGTSNKCLIRSEVIRLQRFCCMGLQHCSASPHSDLRAAQGRGRRRRRTIEICLQRSIYTERLLNFVNMHITACPADHM